MKKTIITLCILIGLAATLFFIGWVQFAVPIGKYGVMISKTSGVQEQTIESGIFRWHWEPLIPTNSQIHIFSLDEKNFSFSLQGILPSGNLYSKMLEGNPSFAWFFNLKISAKLSPQMLPSLVKKYDITDQEGLENWIESALAQLSEKVSSDIIEKARANPEIYTEVIQDKKILSNVILKAIQAIDSSFEISDVAVSEINVPDLALYTHAKESYQLYQDLKTNQLVTALSNDAGKSILETLEIERLSQLGEVLTKYPILIDYLAVTNGAQSSTFQSLRSTKTTP